MHIADLLGSPGWKKSRAEWRCRLVGITLPPNPNSLRWMKLLLRLEEQDRAVPQVEVNEVLRFCNAVSCRSILIVALEHTMRNEASEIPAHDAVPSGSSLVVELLRVSVCVRYKSKVGSSPPS